MDDKAFRTRWEELKQYKSFYRVQSASDVLSILSYKWSQVGGEPEIGRAIWEGVNNASHDMTKIIMEHVPQQEQERAFAVLADFINYTFIISAHEKKRKESKKYMRRIIIPAHDAVRKKENTSKEITRTIAKKKRGPNGERLTHGQILKHVQAERKARDLPPLGKPRTGKSEQAESALKAIERHLKDFDY